MVGDADPNAVVSTIIRLEPPLDKPPEELLRAEGGISVEIEGEHHRGLDPADPRSVGFVRLLDELSRQRLPVYLEVDPQTATLTSALHPAHHTSDRCPSDRRRRARRRARSVTRTARAATRCSGLRRAGAAAACKRWTLVSRSS